MTYTHNNGAVLDDYNLKNTLWAKIFVHISKSFYLYLLEDLLGTKEYCMTFCLDRYSELQTSIADRLQQIYILSWFIASNKVQEDMDHHT